MNDYTYKEDPAKAADSRYLHRGKMDWALAENISNSDTVAGKLFQGLSQLEQIRKKEKVFVSNADAWTEETGERAVLCMGRYLDGEKVMGLFNFSEYDKKVMLNQAGERYLDMLSGEERELGEINIPAYGFYYLKKK